MKKRVDNILKSLTLEEKASLCSGLDFWHLKAIEEKGLRKIMVTDGPHGLRKQDGDTDHIGLSKSVPSTCFPTAVTTASSWDTELMFEMGEALGEECLQEKVSVLLGPGANIKRSPLCGRNFEYISEDPYHTGIMAAALINGVQSKGIGTSLKHYVMNNQESRRLTIDTVVDERAQREIYLKGFEIAVKKSQPWTVMCSYNRVDGTYLSDHKRLLTDILKEEWGHTGLVVTDWGATNDRVEGIRAGLELEMPSSGGKNDEKIVRAIKHGKLSVALLDKAVKRIIELILKSQDNKKENYIYDKEQHRKLARKVAANSAVLLKNEGILPLKKDAEIAIIGEFAKMPRFQGAGSSTINPHRIESVCEELDAQNIKYTYAKGYRVNTFKSDPSLIEEAIEVAKKAQIAIVFAGLTDDFESEGFDRMHLNLPDNHNELIEKVLEANPNTAIVLQNGSPVTMPWAKETKAILECYLGGQASGAAAVDVLFGDVNPSGKIAETFPIRLEDNPSYNHFPGSKLTVEYRESIYVGYRYYDKAKKSVLFPFGHGLSYTTFEYSNLEVKQTKYGKAVTFKVKNTGKVDGAEVVQVYVGNAESVLFKADKELRAFTKVRLKAGEEKDLSFDLNMDAFSYYNVNIADWHVENGEYEILIGSSSRDIRLSKKVAIKETKTATIPDYRETLSEYYNLKNEVLDISEEQFKILFGKDLPQANQENPRPFTENSMLGDAKDTIIGKFLLSIIKKQLSGMGDGIDENHPNYRMVMTMVHEMPFRVFYMLGGDRMPKYFVEGILLILNRKFFKGLNMLLKKSQD